ncbi:exosome complex RNA-binding protein Csl4 [Thermococcus sp.]|uniref:exosome complex RNA-binding protein Csl4 n=1 Tax=Thermococcus sp. TaxID=35749 RepID=UPI002612E400|nr:exosome complex RNA-binding protein Csl4 [Thermococcus sp.]
MDERKVKSGDLVLPGDYLGVIEEYFPGDGVKEENGELYAVRAGRVVIDQERMEISVEPVTDTPPLPKVGDVVIGRVIEVKPQTAIVQIIRIEGRENDREIATSKLAGIHISQVDEGYVDSMLNEFRIGDVVRARVISAEKSPIQLSTKGPDLGVIYALCTRCRTPLVRRGDKLVCPKCGHVETRKLSSMYRKVNI